MSPRLAVNAVVESVGVVVAGVIATVAIAAAVLVALGLPAQSRADDAPPASVLQPRPDVLVVALDLRDPVRQAGVVRGSEIILARGLEVDIAREIARRLGIRRVRFVFVRPTTKLVSAAAPWHLALASLRPTVEAPARTDLSQPYLGSDQAVVLRRGLPRLTHLRDLRGRITCALRGSDAARALVGLEPTTARSILAPSEQRLAELVQTGACDASLVAADDVGRFVAGRGGVLGPVTARIAFGRGSVIAVGRGGPIAVEDVDRALQRMLADGTMHRLARTWLGIDPGRLRLLR